MRKSEGSGPAARGYPQIPPRPVPRSGAAAAKTGPPDASFAQIVSCLRCLSKTHSPRLPKLTVLTFTSTPLGGGGTRSRRVPALGQGLPRAAPSEGARAARSARRRPAERSRAWPCGCAATARPRPSPPRAARGRDARCPPRRLRGDAPAPPAELLRSRGRRCCPWTGGAESRRAPGTAPWDPSPGTSALRKVRRYDRI